MECFTTPSPLTSAERAKLRCPLAELLVIDGVVVGTQPGPPSPPTTPAERVRRQRTARRLGFEAATPVGTAIAACGVTTRQTAAALDTPLAGRGQ
jgi:hypothetical protein